MIRAWDGINAMARQGDRRGEINSLEGQVWRHDSRGRAFRRSRSAGMGPEQLWVQSAPLAVIRVAVVIYIIRNNVICS